MPTVRIEAELTPEKLIEAVEQLTPAELEEFAQRVLALRARRRAPSLSQAEADLLRQINKGAPPDVQRRYDELISMRRAEILTEEDHAELLRLTEYMEGLDAQRVGHLAELARLRRKPLTELMQDLGITPPPYR